MKRAVFVISILLAACAAPAAQESPSAPGDSVEPEPPASVADSAEPSEAAGGDGQLCAEGHPPCDIEAGTYTASPFEPNFSFSVEETWQNDRAFADGGGISQPDGGIYWASEVSVGTMEGEEIEIGASVDEFVAFLQGLETIGATVSEPTPVTVDGVSGQQVDVATNEADLPALYRIAEDQFNLVPGEKARFMVLDKDGETVLLIIDSFTTEGFEDWLATAEPVVDTIRWE